MVGLIPLRCLLFDKYSQEVYRIRLSHNLIRCKDTFQSNWCHSDISFNSDCLQLDFLSKLSTYHKDFQISKQISGFFIQFDNRFAFEKHVYYHRY